MGQTVNLLSFDFGGSNPSAPTQEETFHEKSLLLLFGCYCDLPSKEIIPLKAVVISFFLLSLPFGIILL